MKIAWRHMWIHGSHWFEMRILEQDGGVAIGNAVAKCPTLRHLDLGQILRNDSGWSWDCEWLGGNLIGSIWTGFHARQTMSTSKEFDSIDQVCSSFAYGQFSSSILWGLNEIGDPGAVAVATARSPGNASQTAKKWLFSCWMHDFALQFEALCDYNKVSKLSMGLIVSCSFTTNSGSVILCRHPRQRNYQCWWQGIGQGTFHEVSCHFVLLSYMCVFFLKRLISLQSDFCSCEIFVLCDLCLGPRVSTCNAIEDVATVPTVATIGLLSKGGYWGCVFLVENLSIITWNWKKNRSFHPLIAHIISLMNVARHFGRTANCDRWTCA